MSLEVQGFFEPEARDSIFGYEHDGMPKVPLTQPTAAINRL